MKRARSKFVCARALRKRERKCFGNIRLANAQEEDQVKQQPDADGDHYRHEENI